MGKESKSTEKAGTPPPTTLKLEVCRRLRAVQAELDSTQDEMGILVGESRSAWSNWVSTDRPEMPKVEAMIRLCIELPQWNLTLDWVYRRISDHLPLRVAIRLRARELGLDPDTAGPEVLGRAA